MLRIVQIGVGGFTNAVHGPMLQQYSIENPGELDFAAVCVQKSVDKAREYCQKYGFARVYTDIDEMVSSEKPDACWALTNIEETRKVAGRMMELGIPVLFEKPPGKNLQEATELADISRRTGTPNMVAFNRRFAPCTQKTVEWIKDHGPFESVYARMIRAGRKEPGFAYDTGIHAIDCVRMLADNFFDGIRSARVQRTEALSGGINYHIDMTFGSGATGRCDLIPNCGMNDETYTLFGGNKCIVFTMPWFGAESKAELWDNGKLLDSERWPVESMTRSFGFYQESAAFIEAIRSGRKPQPSAEDVIETVALCEAVAAGRDWQTGMPSAAPSG